MSYLWICCVIILLSAYAVSFPKPHHCSLSVTSFRDNL